MLIEQCCPHRLSNTREETHVAGPVSRTLQNICSGLPPHGLGRNAQAVTEGLLMSTLSAHATLKCSSIFYSWGGPPQTRTWGWAALRTSGQHLYQQMMGRRATLNFKLHASGVVQVQLLNFNRTSSSRYWPCNLQACQCGSRTCAYNCQLLGCIIVSSIPRYLPRQVW